MAAHSGPVTALAYDSGTGSLASGGDDGWVRVSRASGWHAGLDAGDVVQALAWAKAGALVAKIGGPDGRLVLMRPE